MNRSDSLRMASLDITSLFTNIPIDETIDIIIKLLFENKDKKFMSFDKKQFKKLLEYATKDNLLSFNNGLFSQEDDVAM